VVTALPEDEFLTVADVDDGVPGFVWAGTKTGRDDFVRSVRGLYVLPTMERRGIGRVLLRHAAARLEAEGAESVLIGCVRENPSCGFYRHLGGVEVLRRPQRVDRFDTEEVFFGWEHLDRLL